MNNFAISSAGVGEALQRSASSLAVSNNTLDESIALITSANTVVQDPEAVGTALKTVSLRITSTSAQLQELGEDTEYACETLSDYQNVVLGLTKNKVNILDENGQYKSTYDILKQISKVWEELDTKAKSSLMKTLFGTRQANIGTSILENFDVAEQALDKSMNSAGSAMKEQEAYMKSIQYQLDRLKATFETLSNNTLNSSWLKGFVELTSTVLKLVDKVGLLNIALVALGVKLGGSTVLGATKFAMGLEKVIGKMGVAEKVASTLGSSLAGAFTVAGIGLAITGIISLYDKLTVSAEELKETHEKSITTFQEQAQKINDLEGEISSLTDTYEDNEDKLEEIYKLRDSQTLTQAEQDYLSSLENQNTELEKQIEYKRQLADIENKKASDDAIETLNEKTYGLSVQNVDGTIGNSNADWTKKTDYEKLDFYNSQIKGLTQDLENYKTVLDGVELPQEQIDKYTQQLTVYKQQLETNPQNSDIWQPKIDSLQGLVDGKITYEQYQKATDDATNAINEFSLKSSELLPTVEELDNKIIGDTDSNKKLKESVKGIVDETYKVTDKFSDYKNSLSSTTEEINKTKQATEEVTEVISNMSKALDSVKSLSDGMAQINSAFKELSENKSMSTDSFIGMKDSFGNLSSFENFVNVAKDATSTTEDLKKATNDLVTEYIYSSGQLDNVTLSTAELIAKGLEEQGITNALDVALSKLSITSKEYSSIKDYCAKKGIELENVTYSQIDAFVAETNASEQTKNALFNYVTQKLIANGTQLNTVEDCNALANETNASNDTKQSLYLYALQKSLTNDALVKTDGDISNIESLAKACGVGVNALKMLAKAKENYESGAWDNLDWSSTKWGNAEEYYNDYVDNITNQINNEINDKINKSQKSNSASYKSPTANYKYDTNSNADSSKNKKGGSGSTSKTAEEKEQIDYLSQSLDVLKEKVDDAETSLSSLQTNGSKNYFEDQAKAIKKVNTELSGLKTGYTKAKNKYSDLYTDELDKLSSKQRKSIKSKIESGKEFSLKSYDKDTAEIIKSAMGYYNNIQDMNNNIADTTQKIKDNEKQLIQNSLDQLSFEIENIQGKLDNEGLVYKKQNKLLDDKKKLLKEQYTLNKKLATSDEERANLLQEYKESIKDLNNQKYQNSQDLKQNSIDLQQQSIDYLQNEIDKRKELGDVINAEDYDAIITKQNAMRKSYESMYDSMTKQLNKLVKLGSENGGIDEFSTEWYEWQQSLGEISLNIQDINSQLEETKNAINNIKWDNFENGIDKVKNAQDELSDMIDLLGEVKIDEDGNYTEDGLTAIALYGKQINSNQALVNKYRQALSELEKDYKNGKVSQAEYTEKSVEFSDAMRESAKATQDAQDAIVNLKIEQMEAEKTAYREIIDKQKEYLENELEAYQLAKKQAESNQSLARLKSKVAQLEANTSDTDRSNEALLYQLKSELAKREKEQEEQLYEDRNQAERDALDESADNFDKSQDEKINLLKSSTAEREKIIKQSLSTVESQYDTVLSNINGIADQYGITLTDTVTSPWISAQVELQKYMDMVGKLTDVTSNGSTDSIKKILQSANGTGSGTSSLNQTMQSNGYNQLSYKQMAQLANLLAISGKTNYTSGDMESNSNLKTLLLETLVSAGYLNPISITDKTESGFTYSGDWSGSSVGQLKGVTTTNNTSTTKSISSSDTLKNAVSSSELLKKLKLGGFPNGGIIEALNEKVRLNGDDVLISAKVGEGVFKADEVKKIGKLADVIPQIDSIVSSLPKVTSVERVGNGITIDKFIGVEVQGDGIVSEKILAEANKNTYDMLKNQGAKIISQSMKRN